MSEHNSLAFFEIAAIHVQFAHKLHPLQKPAPSNLQHGDFLHSQCSMATKHTVLLMMHADSHISSHSPYLDSPPRPSSPLIPLCHQLLNSQ